MTTEMIPPAPPLAVRVAELDRHVRSGDIVWLREQRAAGSLAWLESHLGPEEYRSLDAAIGSGDLDLVGRRLAVLSDATTVLDEPVAAVTTVGPSVVASTTGRKVIGDPLTTDLDDPTLIVSRHGAVLPAAAVRRERNTLVVTAIILTLIAVGIVAFLLLRNSDDNVADTSVATETIAPDTVVVSTVAAPAPVVSLAVTTVIATPTVAATVPASVPASAPATVIQTTPPSKAVAPAPTATVPLQDAVRTASRSATFGPYLAMVDAAGLTNELRTMKNVTIFAPTESAFAALPTEVQVALRSPSNRDVLARIIRYGVLNQSRSAAQLTPGDYTTLEGSSANVKLLNGTIRINDATITGPDVKVLNGVLHAVDRLLVPGTIDLNALVPRSAPPTAAPSRVTAVASTSPPTAAPTAAPVTTSAPAVTSNTVPVTSPATTAAPTPTVAPTTVAPTTRAPTTVAPTTRAPTTTTA